jgi:hypothetical protein
MERTLPCPLCGTPCQTIDEDCFSVCSVCGWENDIHQIRHPDENGVNKMSFNDAKRLWESGRCFCDSHPHPKQQTEEIAQAS